MFVTSSEQRAGLLVAIVTGGRPELKQRPAARLTESLRAAGVADVVWVISSTDVDRYQADDNPFVVYEREWAYEYARAHWMLPTPPPEDGFLGAFPGREWARLEAERRGCWGVLQLDDNLTYLRMGRGSAASKRVIDENGGSGLYADILSAFALSTNAMTVGAQLCAVSPSGDLLRAIRPGFPYSMFIERVGEKREHWFGPYEDDITHSFQYGDRPDGTTAAVVPTLTYQKESKSKTGMRSHYNHTRSVQLQRMFPQSAKLSIRSTRSNGRGESRVFHTMLPGAIRNPLTVQDKDLFRAAKDRLTALMSEWRRLEVESNRAKVIDRYERHQAKTS